MARQRRSAARIGVGGVRASRIAVTRLRFIRASGSSSGGARCKPQHLAAA